MKKGDINNPRAKNRLKVPPIKTRNSELRINVTLQIKSGRLFRGIRPNGLKIFRGKRIKERTSLLTDFSRLANAFPLITTPDIRYES